MSTIITALAMLGFIALFIGLFLFVHKRDQRREKAKNAGTI